ncbi:helix-turn-helix domain-containing protein [Clostridium butyricum]
MLIFIHRNTSSGRLEKIKYILNIDFNDYNKVFSLYLSVCAYELLNYK